MLTVETPRPEYEFVSPERARGMLETMVPNRKLKRDRVAILSRAMLKGDFDPYNGESIKIDHHARVIDGQHRLQAIVESGVGQPLLVFSGAAPHSIYTVDVGTARSLPDALTIRGEKSASYLATTIKGAYGYVNGYFGKLNHPKALAPTIVECLEMLEMHPSIRDASVASGRLSTRATEHGKFLTPSAYGPLWWVFAHFSESDTEEFFDRLSLGDNLAQDNPIWILRRSLTNLRSQTGAGFAQHIDYTMAITVKAWNAWLLNSPIKGLRWRPEGSKNPEPFPTVVGEDVIKASIDRELQRFQSIAPTI